MPASEIPGAPPEDLRRSPAAATVGALAARSGLLLAHFEHREHLPWPGAWEPQGRPDLGDAVQGWSGGHRVEPKFRSFQLDRRIGSFHPGHRGKWTAHELCHGLVGFAWAPGRSALWHATAARLSELLPVVVYYFLDEAGLRRCPAHDGGGPLYQRTCAACDAAAREGPRPDRRAELWLTRGRRFLDAELLAVDKTRRAGRVRPHHHATLDLSSDGLAYAAAHLPRLRSDAFAAYLDRFFVVGGGWHDRLDGLVNRIRQLFDALAGTRTAPSLAGDRATWIAQDLAWRVVLVQQEAEGDVLRELDAHVLAPLERATRGGGLDAVAEAIDAYRGVHDAYVVPTPAELFGVGYALPGGVGRSEAQVAEGLQSALPGTWALLGEDALDLAADFTWEEPPMRAPIGARFTAWLTEGFDDGPVSDQARFEAAVTHAPPRDEAELTLGGDQPDGDALRLARGATCLVVSHAVSTDPDALLEDGAGPLDAPLHLLIQRLPSGEVAVYQLSDGSGRALLDLGDGEDPLDDLPPGERAELVAVGALVPARWVV